MKCKSQMTADEQQGTPMLSCQLVVTFLFLTNPRDTSASYFWSIEDIKECNRISQFSLFLQGFIYSVKTVKQTKRLFYSLDLLGDHLISYKNI